MDRRYDYLVYSRQRSNAHVDCALCDEAWDVVGAQHRKIHYASAKLAAGSGSRAMLPYLNATLSKHECTAAIELYTTSPGGGVIKATGDFTVSNIPACGTWFGSARHVESAFEQLRCAATACASLPALHKLVLEQKNDDGLLYLVNTCVQETEAVSLAVDTFGVFACDAILAPVLHEVLRSDWLRDRKLLDETHNELKPGWAQEFYD